MVMQKGCQCQVACKPAEELPQHTRILSTASSACTVQHALSSKLCSMHCRAQDSALNTCDGTEVVGPLCQLGLPHKIWLELQAAAGDKRAESQLQQTSAVVQPLAHTLVAVQTQPSKARPTHEANMQLCMRG